MDTKRFHNPEYKRQVYALRHHKRALKKLPPEGGWQKFLHYLGLGSIFRRIAAAVIFLFLIYLVYFAQFLKITDLRVQGADQNATQEISDYFHSYIRGFVYFMPQRNILLFSAEHFKRYLLARDLSISSVDRIKRGLWHSVEITVSQRVPQFNLQSNGNFYILNSDGTVGIQVQAVNPNYLGFIDTSVEQLNSGQVLLNAQKLSFLNYLNANFAAQTQTQIDHYEMPGTASNDLILFSKTGFKVVFDESSDSKVSLQRFFTIWTGLNPDQRKKLAYVDLRFDPKAYLCYAADPCAKK